MNNFSERIHKCFTAGYSQSVSLQEVTDKLLSLTNVEVKLENETENSAEYSIIKIGGNKLATVLLNTNNGGSIIITEYNDLGEPYPSFTSVKQNYDQALTKLKEIINNRLTKNFGKVKTVYTDVNEVIYQELKKLGLKISDKDLDNITQKVIEAITKK